MKHVGLSVLALAMCSSAALAGGIDRSGQGIGFMFESGNYAEFSYANVTPSVKATPNVYGNVGDNYSLAASGFKYDLNDKVSLGIAVDQPYGADTVYNSLDFKAHLESSTIKILGRYKFGNGFSVHGGLADTTVSGFLNPAGGLPLGAQIDVKASTDMGYILGAAYERPEIAARVALTYFSETTHTDDSSLSSVNAPQSVNLDFQTGIAANTLLFGTVRWGEWSKTVITVAGADIVTYDKNTLNYSLGLGRKFNDSWSGAVTLGYETPQGGISSPLAPSDGRTSIGLGTTYTKDNMKISLGYSYTMLGDTTTAGLPFGNTWKDNSASAIGVKVAFTF